MKVLLTGSHFTPAQAVIEELKQDPKVEIVYLGRKYTREGDKTLSVESQVLPGMGVKFIPITAGRLQRTFTPYTLPSLLKIPLGLFQSFYYILKEKPDIVVSFGGYVGVPVVLSAWLLSIPILIHEQTLLPGLANRVSALFADKIALSFDQNNVFDKGKTVVTGNPLRKELVISTDNVKDSYRELVNRAVKEKIPLIIITGGNQGSHIINQAVMDILPEVLKKACIIHQTGDSKFADFEKLSQLKKTLTLKERYLATKWIDASDLKFILSKADLAVTRAGINSLLEYAYFKVPVLVIPISPHPEQEVNAKFFKDVGLATVLHQNLLSGKTLLENINRMVADLNGLKVKAKEAQKLVVLDAVKRLSLEILILAQKALGR